MSFLSAVAGDGKGNITSGNTADRYLDKMNEIRHNVAATQFKDHGAEEQKKLATEYVDNKISEISTSQAQPEQQIEAFNQFRNRKKPV